LPIFLKNLLEVKMGDGSKFIIVAFIFFYCCCYEQGDGNKLAAITHLFAFCLKQKWAMTTNLLPSHFFSCCCCCYEQGNGNKLAAITHFFLVVIVAINKAIVTNLLPSTIFFRLKQRK